MDFNNTPIERLWFTCKWFTTGVAFILALVLLFWSVMIFVADRDDFIVGVALGLISAGLMLFDRLLAQSLIEEELERKRKLEFFD